MNSSNLTAVISNCAAFMSAVPQYQKKYFVVAFGINAFLATTLNSIIFIAYLKSNTDKKWSYKLIMSLAVGDILVGLLLSPITVVQVASTSYQNCFVNKLGSFMVSFLSTSALTIVAISFDRYERIKGVVTDVATVKRVCLYFVLPWSCPVLLVIAKFCGGVIFTVCVLIIFALGYGFLFYSYIRLIRLLKEPSDPAANQQLEIIRKKNKKAVNFILFLSTTFVVLSFNILLYRTLKLTSALTSAGSFLYLSEETEATFICIGQLMFQFNSSINPLIYFLKVPKLRQLLFRFIRNNRVGVMQT